MKKIRNIGCLMLCLLLMLNHGAEAATLTERLAAVEAEMGIAGEGNLAERMTALEEMLGMKVPGGATTAERIANLEREAGFDCEEETTDRGRTNGAGTVPLSSLTPFTSDYVFTDFSRKQCEDMYSTLHTSTVFAEASLGFGENVVEYLLRGEYRELKGLFFIPKTVSSLVDKTDLLRVSVLIYGDDELLYTMPTLQLKDEPLAFSVNVEGVKFLKIEFRDAATISGPYVIMGDAELVR